SMFKVWSENFLTCVVVFLVLALVNNLIAALLAYALLGTFEIGAGVLPGVPSAVLPSVSLWNLILFALLAVIEGIIINSIVVGGMTEYAVRRHRGEKMSLDQALRRGLEKFPSIFGAFFVAGILVLLITLALTLPVGIFRNTIASMIASSVASALVGAWFLILAAVAYDLLVRQPSAAAPTYYPAPPIAPPAGAAQTAQPPGTPPPPSP